MGGLPTQGGGSAIDPRKIRKLTCDDEIDICDRSDRKLGTIKSIKDTVDIKIKDQPIDVKITDEPIDVKIKDQPIDVNVLNAINADITDRCSRLLGRLCFGGVAIDPRDRNWTLDFATDQVDVSGSSINITGTIDADITNRCSRLLGQLCFGGVAIDPRDRNWTLDFATDQVDVSGSSITVGSLTQFTPIEKAVIHDQAMPAANTNILGAGITPTNSPTTFRIMVSISIAAKFSAAITRAATTKTSKFNGGADLVTDTLFIFDMLVHSGDSINFQFSATGGTINDLRVQEIDAATA